MARASHYLRTLFAFGFFGVGGGILSCVVMPVLWLVTPGRERAIQRSQRTLQAGFRLFFHVLSGLRLFKTERPLTERIRFDKPCVIVCSHPCLLDTVAMTIRYDNVVCLVKQSYYENPLFFGVTKLCGYIPAGRPGAVDAHRDMIQRAVELIGRGYSVLAFPEGRRTPIDGVLSFGRGPFEIAARAGVPVVPVRLLCTPRTLAREIPWLEMPLECVTHSDRQLPPQAVVPGRTGTRAAMQRVQALLQGGSPPSPMQEASTGGRAVA